MKPQILFRAADQYDIVTFISKTSYYPGVQFNGIVAYYIDPTTRADRLMGMVGFDSWAPRTVMAHWWIKHPRCIEPLWFEAVSYIAGTGRKAILGATPGDNEKAIKTIKHLGWEELYRVKDGWDEGVDVVISEYKIHPRANSNVARVA